MAKRQKTVFTNSELPHQWVHNHNLDYGRNSNNSMHFEGTVFYSYRTAIAQIIRRDEKHGGTYVLMSNDTFSPTTSRHMSEVGYAVNQFPILYVPFYGAIPGSKTTQYRAKCSKTCTGKALYRNGTPDGCDYAAHNPTVDAFALMHKNNIAWYQDNLNKAAKAVEQANRANKHKKLLAYGRIAQAARKYIEVTRTKYGIKYPIAIPREKFEAGYNNLTIINGASWTGGERELSELEVLINSTVEAACAAEKSREVARARRYRIDHLPDGSPIRMQLSDKSSAYIRKHWNEFEPAIEQAERVRDTRNAINRLVAWGSTEESRALYAELSPLSDEQLEERREELQGLIDAYKAREQEYLEREREARKAQEQLELEEKVELWRRGELRTSLPYNAPTMMRIEPDGRHVETSKGARVPIEAARKALRFVAILLAKCAANTTNDAVIWHRNGEVFPIGIYQLDKVMGDGTVHAGCHIITRGEQVRLQMMLDERATISGINEVTNDE